MMRTFKVIDKQTVVYKSFEAIAMYLERKPPNVPMALRVARIGMFHLQGHSGPEALELAKQMERLEDEGSL